MKYKQKKIEKNKYAIERGCVDETTYAKFTQAAALIEAQQQADRRFVGSTKIFGGCMWSTRVEVRNARYETSTGFGFGFGLQPLPRCETVNNPGGGSSLDILESKCKDGRSQEVNEYIPGGSKPPCANGVEGACVFVDSQESWSQGSSWKLDTSKPNDYATIILNYDFRLVANSIIRKTSGANCIRPEPDPWQTKIGAGLTSCTRCKAKITTESRCYDVTSNYDCCCSCPPDQVKVPQIVPGLAPCYSYNNASQAQLESLLKAATAALVVGACAAAVVFAAKYTALFLAGLAANPVTAGCAIRMIPLIVPCIVQGDESEN